MRFYTNDKGHMFVENGASKIRVSEISKEKMPNKRIARLFLVQDVIKQVESSPIYPMQMIALSFPPEKANAKEYTWKNGEKAIIKVSIDLHDVSNTEGDIAPANN